MAVSQMPRTFTANHVVSTDELNAFGAPNRCDGRLTLTSATPVTTADVTGAGTIYFTPYKGNEVALFDGTQWISYEFTERSLALTLTSGSVYDVFLYNNSGTLTLETLVWTNTTTRATALVLQDGILCKTGALTRRYLGTIYATGTNVTADSGGAVGTAAFRCVWNYYNRVPRRVSAQEAATTWNYNTSSYRAANNGVLVRLSMVIGVSEDPVSVAYDAMLTADGAGNALIGVGLDQTTANSAAVPALVNPYAGGFDTGHCPYNGFPGIGFHYLNGLEYGIGSGTNTWYGSAYSALNGFVMA